MKTKFQVTRLLALFVVAVFMVSVVAGCGTQSASEAKPAAQEKSAEKPAETPAEKPVDKPAQKQIVIGATLLNFANNFIVKIKDGMEAKAKEMGVKLILNDAQRDASKQIQQVETFIAQKVDAIVLQPCEYDASSPCVEKAKAAGIPIVLCNQGTKVVGDAIVSQADFQCGQLAMGYIAKRLNGKGNIAIIRGYPGQSAEIERTKGVKEVLAQNPDIKLLAEQTGEWDRAKTMSVMENYLQAFGDKLNAVYVENDEMAMGALKAIQAANKKDKIILVGSDFVDDARPAVKEGTLDASVYNNAPGQGAGALEVAVKIVKGEKYDKELLLPFELVTKENVDEYLKRP